MTKKTEENKTEEVTIIPNSIVVIIEWNGSGANQTFYNRLYKYGILTRRARFQSKDEIETKTAEGETLYDWRAKQTGSKKSESHRGLVLQEGVIQVSSAELAHEIQQLAIKYGAYATFIANMSIVNSTLEEKDQEIFAEIERKTSKRGVKPRIEAGHYIVTCFSEVKTYEIASESLPIRCPMCNSISMEARLGQPRRYRWTYDKNVDSGESFWVRTRFGLEAGFEIPIFENNAPTPPMPQDGMWAFPNSLKDFWNWVYTTDFSDFNGMKKLIEDTRRDINLYLRLCDVVYAAGLKPMTYRTLERPKIWGDYVAPNPNASDWSLAVPSSLDLLDVVKLDNDFAKYL